MSTTEEKSAPVAANVLTITRPSAARSSSNQSIEVLSTIEDVDSTHSTSPTQSIHNEKSLDRENSPLSPFYNPIPTRYSLEKNKSELKQNINIIRTSSYDTDVEALAPHKTGQTSGKMSLLNSKSRAEIDCSVWPGQDALKQKKKAMRKEQGKYMMCCGWMAGLDRKTKISVKILIGLLIVGIAIGVGVGVSKTVGGGVWKNNEASNAPMSDS